LERELREIGARHARKLSKVGGKKDETQKKLNIEEKERELFGLKLEQMLVNNKKLQLQKKFLERKLGEDLRELHLEMTKCDLEIQEDQILNSAAVGKRLKSVY